MIPISKPALGAAEQRAAQAVLASGMLAQGPRVAAFERAFADYIGVKHAIATNNGTTALHTALLAHGIGIGDEVLTVSFTFIASVNAILYTGATPVLADIDSSFNLDPAVIARAITPRTRAIMPVHLFGQPCDMGAILEIARRHNLVVVEDACQAHGAAYRGKRVGTFGTAGFSFYATKNMTTGEGGMLTTNDDDVAARARLLINHGMKVRYHHEILGYNYRMTELAAAIGMEQLKQLDGFNSRRAANAAFYDEQLGNLTGIETPRTSPDCAHVYHQYTLRVTPECTVSRDQLVTRLNECGIGTGIYYPIPVHLQDSARAHAWSQVSLPQTERAAQEVLSIPVHPGISDADREYIAATIQTIAHAGKP